MRRITIVIALALAVPGCKKGAEETSDPRAETPPAEPAKSPEQKPPEQKPIDAAPAAAAPDKKPGAGQEVTYKAGDVELKGYLATDPAVQGKRPGILVVHEWWGHNEHARASADRLAAMGYTALAVNMYGDGKQAAHPDEAGKFSSAVTPEIGKARFDAARELLAKHETVDPEKISAIGYCFGGGIVLEMARAGEDLDGVASFHGTLTTKTPAAKGAIKAKLLVLHGEADPFIPADKVEAFKKEMADAGADLEFVSYPNATHAFTNPAATELGKKFNLPIAYDADVDKQSWQALTAFLAKLYPR